MQFKAVLSAFRRNNPDWTQAISFTSLDVVQIILNLVLFFNKIYKCLKIYVDLHLFHLLIYRRFAPLYQRNEKIGVEFPNKYMQQWNGLKMAKYKKLNSKQNSSSLCSGGFKSSVTFGTRSFIP